MVFVSEAEFWIGSRGAGQVHWIGRSRRPQGIDRKMQHYRIPTQVGRYSVVELNIVKLDLRPFRLEVQVYAPSSRKGRAKHINALKPHSLHTAGFQEPHRILEACVLNVDIHSEVCNDGSHLQPRKDAPLNMQRNTSSRIDPKMTPRLRNSRVHKQRGLSEPGSHHSSGSCSRALNAVAVFEGHGQAF